LTLKGPERPLQRILVTGTHYSATTLVGEVLASSRGCAYVGEIFNISKPISLGESPFDVWYKWIDDEEATPELISHLDELMSGSRLGRRLWTDLKRVRSPRDLLHVALFLRYVTRQRMASRALIIKDPIALLSAKWLASRFGMKAVLMIRHPCAFVESVIRKGAVHPFSHFLVQERLMWQLEPWRSQFERFDRGEGDLVEQAAVLWAVLNELALGSAGNDSNFIIIKHMALAARPYGVFERIFEHVGLPFDKSAQSAIFRLMRRSGDGEIDFDAQTAGARYTERDPIGTVEKWRSRLSQRDIDRVRAITHHVADSVYTEAELDWANRRVTMA
jgi:Sulfotransferase family